MYDLRFCVANSVTSNITNTPYPIFNLNVCMLYDHIRTVRQYMLVSLELQTNLFQQFLIPKCKEHQ
jgi:hypothetical protein